jgi:2-succinyl-5-enolpyruvyl-6-hydroxy-3-cyclohexene-1-carboxylate synthase
MTDSTPDGWSDDYNLNAVWCRLLVDQLVGAGIRDVILCPGGRSASLALQIHNDPRLGSAVQTDERIGAFLALGMARAAGRPVAVCTTSGSAVANLVPALCEADASSIPVVLLTCDRPIDHRGTGAWQTTDQLAICAPFVRAGIDLPEPTEDPKATARVLTAVAATLARATAPGDQGPVQLNIPLHGRLCPTAPEPGWTGPSNPLPAPETAADVTRPPSPDVTGLLDRLGLGPGLRGLIVAGPAVGTTSASIDTLADLTGYPVLADAPSGLRRPANRYTIGEADALVLHPFLTKTRPEVIIRIGQAPVSHTVHDFLAAQTCPQLRDVLAETTGDILSRNSHALGPLDAATVQRLGNRLGPGDAVWCRWWEHAGIDARSGLQRAVERLPWGESKAVATICQAAGFDFIHLANSMAIRNANLHLPSSPITQPIYANRGLNGIDGTIATFIGETRATGGRGLLLIGDQAAQHDLSALGTATEQGLRGCICVINNAGGAVFDLVACHRLPGYQEAIRHPTTIDLAAIARAFGLPFSRCHDETGLTEALATAESQQAVCIIEAVVPPDSLAGEINKLFIGMVRAAVLGQRQPA